MNSAAPDFNFRDLITHYQVVVTRDRGDKATAFCPFPDHREKTPSFSIDYSKKAFYCFGCGMGGGAVRFVELIEGCERDVAVDIIQDLFGVDFGKNGRRYVHPFVATRAGYIHRLFMNLSGVHGWLRTVTYEQVEGWLNDAHIRDLQDKKQSEQKPGLHLYKSLEAKVDIILVEIAEAWRRTWPAGLSALRDAHIRGDEDGYFSAWDENIDRFVIERDLFIEIKRLSALKCDRAFAYLVSENKKKMDKGQLILTSWIGCLKRMLASGIYQNRNLVFREW